MTIFGGLGKRVDHTFYNLHLLARFPYLIEMESEQEKVFLLKNQDIISTFPGQMISLIPLSESVINVNSRGLKWELLMATLNRRFMSISNISLGQEFSISFDSGILICCMQK